MSEDITKDYADLLAALTAAGIRAGIWAVREGIRDATLLRQRLQQAVKPPEWAPKDKAEWDRHAAVKNAQGQTIGYADTKDPLVATLEGKDRGPGAMQLLNIAGAMWLGTQAAKEASGLDSGTVVTAGEAHQWLSEQGWTILGDPESEGAASPVDGKPLVVDPAQADLSTLEGPVLVESGEAQLPGTVSEVVATGGEVTVEESTPVQVPGEATVNGEEFSGWDEIAADMGHLDAPAPDQGPSVEERELIAVGPRGPEPAGPGMSM